MFTATLDSFGRTLLAAAIAGTLLTGAAATTAHAGGDGGGDGGGIGSERPYVAMRNPDGSVDHLRGNADRSRTGWRTRNGKVVKGPAPVKREKFRPAPRDRRPSMSMTNPDGSRVEVFRNPDGSRTTVRYDRNGNETGRDSYRSPRPGNWRASGYNHSTGFGGRAAGNAAGAFISMFGVGIGIGF